MSYQSNVCTINHVDHVGIAVEDLDASIKMYQKLFGAKMPDILEDQAQGVKAAFISLGQTTIELLQGLGPETIIARFVSKRGAGLHHLALNVDDIGDKLSMLKGAGIRLIDQAPRQGLSGVIGFIHPGETQGVLIELVQS